MRLYESTDYEFTGEGEILWPESGDRQPIQVCWAMVLAPQLEATESESLDPDRYRLYIIDESDEAS